MPSTKLRHYQISVFPDDNFYYGSAEDIVDHLNIEDSLIFYYYEKTPIPDQAPREIPRLYLDGAVDVNSSEVSVKVELSFTKITFQIEKSEEGKNNLKNIKSSHIQKIIKEVLAPLEEYKIAQRLGLTMIFSIHNINPIDYIIDHILRSHSEELIESSEMRNFKIKLTYDKNILGGRGNHVLGLSKEEISNDEVVQVRSDINTHQNRDATWELEGISKFVKAAFFRQNMSDIFENLNQQNE